MATPVAPVTPTPAPAPVQGGTPSGEPVPAQVTNLPPSLANTDRAIVLRGEVQNANPQTSTVTIATPRGPVEVKIPQPLPQNGQRVEVTLQAGSPPTEGTVRTVQTQTPPPTTQTPMPPQPGTVPPPQAQVPGHAATLPAIPLLQGDDVPVIVRTPASPVPQAAPSPGAGAGPQNPAAATAETQISPQNLLNFLKTTLQSALKSPGAANAQQSGMLLGAQRPLEIGQPVRLLPAVAGALPQTAQMPAPVAGQTPALGAQIAPQLFAALKGAQAPILPGVLQTQTPPAVQSMVPASAIVSSPAMPIAAPQDALGAFFARILQPLMGQAVPMPAGTSAAPLLASLQPQTGLSGMLQTVVSDMTAALPRTVSGPVTALPQIQTPVIDARLAATLPVLQNAAAQNPGIANLLHGTPSLPVLFGQVAGQTAQGLPIIQMPVFSGDGPAKTVMMTLQFPAKAMAPGTWVRMDVMQTSLPMASGAALPAGMPVTTAGWEPLDELMSVLRASAHGDSLVQMTQNALPKPGSAAFTAPVLLFLAATRGGDVTAWLGERVTDAVRNMRRADILTRLSGAAGAGAAARREDAQVSGDWKTVTLPMMGNETQLSQIHMHYRSFERDGDADQDAQSKTGARFVLDLSLTRIGPLQIDGLSVGRQLDVTLRSEQEFSAQMREALRLRYSDALGGIGFSGQLNFRADGDHKGWVDFREADTLHATARA